MKGIPNKKLIAIFTFILYTGLFVFLNVDLSKQEFLYELLEVNKLTRFLAFLYFAFAIPIYLVYSSKESKFTKEELNFLSIPITILFMFLTTLHI